MIAIKGRTQSWGCFRSRYAWCWQLIENANTQADEWEECWVCTAWKDYPPHFRRGGVCVCVCGGVGDAPCIFLQRENQTNWIWSIAVPLGRARCLQRQCDTADPRRRHNKTLIRQQQGQWEKKLHLELTFANCEKKRESHIFCWCKHQRKPPYLPVYQTRRSLSVISHADGCCQTLNSLCKVLGYLKSTRQIKTDRQAQAGRQTDRQMDAQAEPLCAVVLTTEQEQHPGLRV